MRNIIQKSSILLIPLFITMTNSALGGINDNDEISDVFRHKLEELEKMTDKGHFDGNGTLAHSGEKLSEYPGFYGEGGYPPPLQTTYKPPHEQLD